MSGIEIREGSLKKGQRGGRKGQEGQPAPPYRASWSTANSVLDLYNLEMYSTV